jgi:diguanylate cyclase (GGDEF)-like protein
MLGVDRSSPPGHDPAGAAGGGGHLEMMETHERSAGAFPIREVAEAIGAGQDVEAGLGALIDRLGRDLSAEITAVVAAPREGRREPVVRASWTATDAELRTPLALAYEDLLARAVTSDEPVFEPIRFHPVWHRTREPTEGSYALAVPVRGGRYARGCLFAAFGQPPENLDRAIHVASDYAALAAVCLRDAVEIDELREQATHDELTGCLNRAGTLAALTSEIARCERHGHPLCVCFLDIDRFKRVNEEHGHLVGDRALRQIGRALGGATRRYDTVGRFGGDEFLVVMPETEAVEAAAAADRLVEAVTEVSVGGMAMGASFGVAEWEPGKSTDEILMEADPVLLVTKGARPASARPTP